MRLRLPLLVWVLSGCADASAPADVVVADSAGIRVVHNLNSAARESDWAIPPTPVFRLGWGEGDPQFQAVLYGAILPDGTVRIADGRANELYAITAEGAVMWSVGGPGEGPGEFRGIAGLLHASGDSLLITDTRNNRITVVDGQGTVVGESPYQSVHGLARYVPVARTDGHYVLLPGLLGGNSSDPVGWHDRPIFRTTNLSDWEVIAELPLWYEVGPNTSNPLRQFGRFRANGQGIVILQTDRPRAAWYGPDGNLTQVSYWDQEVREADDEAWAELESWARADLAVPSEQLEEILGRWREGFAGTVPMFGLAHLDRAGNVWLGDSGLLPRWESRYRLLSADGVWLGQIEFPRPVSILDISERHALVVETDELDIQAVALYEILGPPD